MSCVLTLIVKPGDENTLTSAIQQAEHILRSTGAKTDSHSLLGAAEAADISFTPQSEEDIASLMQTLNGNLSNLNVDIYVQRTTERSKALLLADMDSTMIENECIDELADYAGVKADVAKITEQAMQGKLDFEASLKARVKLLAGLNESVLAECLSSRISVRKGAKTLIQTAKKQGMRCVLVSGGFTFFTSHIASLLGFDRHVANRLGIEKGVLTGEVIPPLSGPATKLNVLREECQNIGINAGQVIAVGDGANDIPMLEAAGLGVAVHAKPKTAAAADIALKHGELHAILYLMGLPKDQFVSS